MRYTKKLVNTIIFALGGTADFAWLLVTPLVFFQCFGEFLGIILSKSNISQQRIFYFSWIKRLLPDAISGLFNNGSMADGVRMSAKFKSIDKPS